MLLILDDDCERIMKFTQLCQAYQIELMVWQNALSMLAELNAYLPKARLISLDHDLYPQQPNESVGCGRDVANYLATCPPVCPVIIHSSNIDAAWGMYNELNFAHWQVTVIPHTGQETWYKTHWLMVVQQYLKF